MINVGDTIKVWWSTPKSGKRSLTPGGNDSTVLEIKPYTGRYQELFNCILVLESLTPKGTTEMTYNDEDRR